MRSRRSCLICALLIGITALSSAFGQEPAPVPDPDHAPAAESVKPSPDVTEVPPAADFLVLPLRVHILSATDLPAIECGLTDDDIARIVGKVNGIWHKAGIHWALGPIVREPAANQDRFKALEPKEGRKPLTLYRMLVPEQSRADEGIDVYYLHAFPVNGVFFGNRTAFVQETAKLRPVLGGIDEPLPRVTAHELGHALGLPHRQDRTNLLASGTSGTLLNRDEVERVRGRAPRMPGVLTEPDLRRQFDQAKDKGDAVEVARLDLILSALPATASPPNPASTR